MLQCTYRVICKDGSVSKTMYPLDRVSPTVNAPCEVIGKIVLMKSLSCGDGNDHAAFIFIVLPQKV